MAEISEHTYRVMTPDANGVRNVQVDRRVELSGDSIEEAVTALRRAARGLHGVRVTSTCHGDSCWSRYVLVDGIRAATPEEISKAEESERWYLEQEEKKAARTIDSLRLLYPHLFKDKPNDETTQA